MGAALSGLDGAALSGLDVDGLILVSVLVIALSGLDRERSEFSAAVEGARVEPASEGSGLAFRSSALSSGGTVDALRVGGTVDALLVGDESRVVG